MGSGAVLLANIHQVSDMVNICKSHAHLISTYFITNKFASASYCNIASGWHCM